jgi:hypothetical protein
MARSINARLQMCEDKMLKYEKKKPAKAPAQAS